MPLDHSTKRLPENEEILKKYDGDIHSPEYHREVYVSNMRNYRNRHREKVRKYNKDYQENFRKNNPYYYALKLWNKKHPNNPMTMEQYIEYRTQKEIRRQEKLARKNKNV